MVDIDKLKETISKFDKNKPQFDPSTLNDEVAMKTQWRPAKGGGTNMCTHSLKEVSPRRVEFKARGMALFFPGIFMVAGIGVIIGMTIGGLNQNITMLYFGISCGSIFFLVGFFILRNWMTPRVFDLNIGCYWKGRKEPAHIDMQSIKEHCRLRDIHAIQFLQEYCRSSSANGGNSSYFSYELNLVLKDGNRLNVVDHAKRSLIRTDAEKLSQFLDVPVWDATFR